LIAARRHTLTFTDGETEMCIRTLRESEAFLKGHCQCCKGRKSPARTSWYCAKCDRRIAAAVRRAARLWRK
jgi:hypothetical protein